LVGYLNCFFTLGGRDSEKPLIKNSKAEGVARGGGGVELSN